MKKSLINFLILLILIEFCNGNGYDYPKPELRFDCEDAKPRISKPKVLRGVFFYTYDDNYSGKEIEMHELKLDSFNKLVASPDYVKSPATLKSTFNFVEFFDGRCQASVNCERIPQEYPSASSSNSRSSASLTTTTPSPATKILRQEVSKLFSDGAPQITQPQLEEIMAAIDHINVFAQRWSPHQVHEIGTRNSFVVQSEMQKPSKCSDKVMRFADDVRLYMSNYINEFDPCITEDDTLGMIEAIEEVTSAIRNAMTFEQFKAIRGAIVAEFVTSVEVEKPTERTTVSTTSKPPATTTSKPPTTTTTSPPYITSPWPSNTILQQKITKILTDYAPQLTDPQLDQIMNSFAGINRYTQYWTASQIDEIGTRNSLIVQDEMLKQNTSGTASVMKFSDKIKQEMIDYVKKYDPYLSLEDTLGMIKAVEQIGTANMRYVTHDQFKAYRGPIVDAFVEHTKINGYISTTHATTKAPTTTTTPQTTATPWPSNYELQQEVSDIFVDFAPQLTEPHLLEIMTALKNMNTYTQYWTADQVDQISTRNSLIVQQEMLKQNTTANAVMRFSDELKQHMINYTREINPDMSLDEILGMISIVEEIGTATMRYLTFDQYKGLRGPVVSAFAENTVVNGFVSTTKAPTAPKAVKTTSPATTTSKPPTTTKKPVTTTKTYIPPPGSSRKPYTRWVGQTYRQFSGQYSFGYTWKPFTGGYSWRSRRYSAESTTTTERYRQKSLVNEFNPVAE